MTVYLLTFDTDIGDYVETKSVNNAAKIKEIQSWIDDNIHPIDRNRIGAVIPVYKIVFCPSGTIDGKDSQVIDVFVVLQRNGNRVISEKEILRMKRIFDIDKATQ